MDARQEHQNEYYLAEECRVVSLNHWPQTSGQVFTEIVRISSRSSCTTRKVFRHRWAD